MDVDDEQAGAIVDADNDEATAVTLGNERDGTASAIATNSGHYGHGEASSVVGTNCVNTTNNLNKKEPENVMLLCSSMATTNVQVDVAPCQNSDIAELMPNENHRSSERENGILCSGLFSERDVSRANDDEMLPEERQLENAGIDPKYPVVLMRRVSMEQDNVTRQSIGESSNIERNTLRNNENHLHATPEPIEIDVSEQREEQQMENAGIDPKYPIVLLKRVSMPPSENANGDGDSTMAESTRNCIDGDNDVEIDLGGDGTGLSVTSSTVANPQNHENITGSSCSSVTFNLCRESLENDMQCSSNVTPNVETDTSQSRHIEVEEMMPNEDHRPCDSEDIMAFLLNEYIISSDSESGTSSTIVSNDLYFSTSDEEVSARNVEAEQLQEERQIENAGIDPNYPVVLVERVAVPSMMEQDNTTSESLGQSSNSELNSLRNNHNDFLATLERFGIDVPEPGDEQQIEDAGIDPNYPIVLLERVSVPPIDNANSGGDSSTAGTPRDRAEDDPIIDVGDEMGPPAAAAENSTDFDDSDFDSDFDIHSMSEDDQNEADILQDPNYYNFHNHLVVIRNMIQETRRSMAEAEFSYPPYHSPRNALTQRFRRVLFILNSRRRRLIRLIRLGSPAPDEENPEGEANAEIETAGQHFLNEIPENGDSNMTLEQEEMNENAVRFDTSLPVQHSYLGTNMDRVSGVNYLDDHQYVKLRLFVHQHVLFPGEVLPFMVSSSASIIDGDHDSQNGIMFGLCFPSLVSGGSNKSEQVLYGVTCQIYELGTDGRGNTLIKSRALQRFVTKMDELTVPLENINSHPRMKCSGYVKILPDIYVPEPFKCMNMGSMNRFRDNESMTESYRRFQAATMPWPAQIYETHNINNLLIKAKAHLAQHKIDTMPTDPTQLSYWLLRNLHLPEDIIKSVFLADTVNTRLKLLANAFAKEAIFACLNCGTHIANCRELFAMSKHGVQSQYCNSAGYIHETNTVYRVSHQNIVYSGAPSTEFSWFPGYQWRIIECKFCEHHLGWEFKAIEPNLVPKVFFGISSASVRVRFALEF